MLSPLPNTLSEETLNSIREYAGLFFGYDDIAILLGLDMHSFRKAVTTKGTPAWTAYQQGKLQQELVLRRKIVDMAIKGSPQAETTIMKLIHQQKISEKNATN
jgi:hypothetical protein